jgi:hypothetical protein
VDALIVERWGVDIIIVGVVVVVDVGQGGGGIARVIVDVAVAAALALALALGLGSGDPPPPEAVRKEGTGLARKELFMISPCPADVDAATTAEEEAEP